MLPRRSADSRHWGPPSPCAVSAEGMIAHGLTTAPIRGLPAPGPRAARRGKQDPPQGALGRVPRSSRDASALAPVTRRAKVDEAASPARAPRDRSEGLQADPSDGEGEPSVGIPADQRRAGEARDPRLRDEYRDASPPLLASVRPPAGA